MTYPQSPAPQSQFLGGPYQPPSNPVFGDGGAPPGSLPPEKSAKRWLIPLCTGILGLIVGSASAGGDTTTSTTASGSVTSTVTTTITAAAETVTVTEPAETVTVKPSAAAAIPGDGTFLVGIDVKPGTYRSGKPSSGNCYWARMKGDSGQLGDIIANNNSAGPSVVTIKSTDKIFESNGCEDWTKVK